MADNESHQSDLHGSLISHLTELRSRILKIVLCVSVVMLGMLPFQKHIYTIFAQPYLDALPDGSQMQALSVLEPLWVPLKLVMVLAIVVSLPYLLFQAWAFVSPGLYKKERRLAFPILFSSVLLFYAGIAFSYFFVFELAFPMIVSFLPENVVSGTSISNYFSFAIGAFLGFGLAFETPIAIILIVLSGMATPDQLASKRRYIIVFAFIVGMIFTPPDVISQIMLAVPVWFLFEVGLLVSRLVKPAETEESEIVEEAD